MSAQWPNAVSTAANLYTAVNLLQTTLSVALASGTPSIITVASTTGFPTAGAVTIDNEVIFYTGVSGNTLTGLTRGSDGTVAASHNAGVPVGATVIANHINALTAEVIAIEADLHTRFGFGSTDITLGNLTATTVPYLDASKVLKSSAVTPTELAYVSGVTSAIQTQISNRVTKDSLVYNVLDHGAVGNGSTDDTAAINTLIASLSSGGTVYFPPATYRIATSRGIEINVSDITLVFAGGAKLSVTANAGITVNNTASSTIERITILGAHLVNAAAASVPNAGILVNPNDPNTVNYLVIDNFLIDGFGQYGITGGGCYNHLTITNGKILNNGPTTGHAWGSQAFDILPGHVRSPGSVNQSYDLIMDNIYMEETGNSVTSSEMDGAKLQGFIRATVSNLTINGGGNASVTGACLVISQNSDFVGTNIVLTGIASTGLVLDTTSDGRNSLTNIVIDTTAMIGDAVVLSGCTGMKIDDLQTAGAVRYAGTQDGLVLINSAFSAFSPSTSPVVQNSLIRNNKTTNAIQVAGDSNQIIENIIIGNAGNDAVLITGNSNTVLGNFSLNSGGYGARLVGNTNIVANNVVINPTTGGYIVQSGTGNILGINFGVITVSDSGTGTTNQNIYTGLTASRALVTGSSKELAISAVTSTELGYLSGVTSAIQTQFTGKAAIAGQQFTGNISFDNYATHGLVGTGTNNDAAAGNVGEYVESVVSNQSVGTSGQYSDITSITLTAGDWDVYCLAFYNPNGATISGSVEIGIGTTTGNSGSGLVTGSNDISIPPTTSGGFSGSIPCFRVSTAGSVTKYFKQFLSYSVATPKVYGKLWARRVR